MNYYDEEIAIGASEPKNLNNIKMAKIPSARSSIKAGEKKLGGSSRRGVRPVKAHDSTDDDGLLQDILNHDDDNDDDDDDDDDDVSNLGNPSANEKQPDINKPQPAPRPLPRSGATTRPSSSTLQKRELPKRLDADSEDDDASETESDEILDHKSSAKRSNSGRSGASYTNEPQFNVTPDKWESLTLPPDVKNLFLYILNYTPQTIDTPYHLQPFVPDYVPAVGDVDAFLKVSIPPPLQPQRQQELNEHLRRMGLHFLDEPSGHQSEPSLLNMKLRSALTGSGANRRSASAQPAPIARSSKDIDKWIAEVEEVHMAQSVFDAQPSKDIEALLINWPRSFADARDSLLDAYQRALQEELSLTEYIKVLCGKFEVGGRYETQVDFIMHIHSLFAMYLAASQAWE